MTETKGWPAPPKIATAAALGAGFLATAAVNWPGHLSYDSFEQLWEGRIGVYSTWHPPVMAWLLGLFDAILPGAGLFVLFQTTLAFAALAVLLFLGRARWRSVAVVVGIVLLPQMLLYQGLVWKDVLFADAAITGFALLAWVAAHWRGPRSEIAVLAMFALVTLAALARQNGPILLPFVGLVIAWTARRHGGSWRETLTWSIGSVAVMAAFAAASTIALDHRSSDGGRSGQIESLALYDLSGAVAQEPSLHLDILAKNEPRLDAAIRILGAKLYSPVREDAVIDDPAIQSALTNTAVLMDQWRDLIFGHPLLYLRIRTMAFIHVFAMPDLSNARSVFTGVNGPPAMMARLHMPRRADARDFALERYGKALFGTPVWSHLTFAAAAVACLIVLCRRRRSADIAVAAMLLSALAFTASFFVISVSSEYRYLYFLDLSVLAALFYLSIDTREAS